MQRGSSSAGLVVRSMGLHLPAAVIMCPGLGLNLLPSRATQARHGGWLTGCLRLCLPHYCREAMGSDPTQVGSQANTLVMDIRKRKGECCCIWSNICSKSLLVAVWKVLWLALTGVLGMFRRVFVGDRSKGLAGR